jgi:AcrR family transcriptional regulator
MRGIAREAHVDPALVHHFFLSKEGVFAAATRDAVDLSERIPEILGSDREGVGERLVWLFLSLWEGAAQDKTFLGIIRSAMSHEESARMLREFVSTEGLGRLARAMEQPEPELRASLIGSQLVGLAVMRYVVKVRPLASLGTEDVVARSRRPCSGTSPRTSGGCAGQPAPVSPGRCSGRVRTPARTRPGLSSRRRRYSSG